MKNKVSNKTTDHHIKNAKVVYIHSVPPYWRDYEIQQPTEEGIYVCLGAVSGRARQLEQHFVDFCEYIVGAGFDVDLENSERIITHWLPVPELPEGDKLSTKKVSVLF